MGISKSKLLAPLLMENKEINYVVDDAWLVSIDISRNQALPFRYEEALGL